MGTNGAPGTPFVNPMAAVMAEEQKTGDMDGGGGGGGGGGGMNNIRLSEMGVYRTSRGDSTAVLWPEGLTSSSDKKSGGENAMWFRGREDEVRSGHDSSQTRGPTLPSTFCGRPTFYASWCSLACVWPQDVVGKETARESHNRVALEQIAAEHLIDPNSKFRRRWDMIQIAFLLYIAVVLPYRIGFDKMVPLWSSWFFFDFVVDTFFIVDVFVSFRTAFYTPTGELEYRASEIGKT